MVYRGREQYYRGGGGGGGGAFNLEDKAPHFGALDALLIAADRPAVSFSGLDDEFCSWNENFHLDTRTDPIPDCFWQEGGGRGAF